MDDGSMQPAPAAPGPTEGDTPRLEAQLVTARNDQCMGQTFECEMRIKVNKDPDAAQKGEEKDGEDATQDVANPVATSFFPSIGLCAEDRRWNPDPDRAVTTLPVAEPLCGTRGCCMTDEDFVVGRLYGSQEDDEKAAMEASSVLDTEREDFERDEMCGPPRSR